MRFNKRKAFMDSFPMYMMSVAVFIFAIIINDITPNPFQAELAFQAFTWFSILILIPATAYLIIGGMKKDA